MHELIKEGMAIATGKDDLSAVPVVVTREGRELPIGPDWRQLNTAPLMAVLERAIPPDPNEKQILSAFLDPIVAKFTVIGWDQSLSDLEKTDKRSDITWEISMQVIKDWGPYMGQSGNVYFSDVLLFLVGRTREHWGRLCRRTEMQQHELEAYRSLMRRLLALTGKLENLGRLRWARDWATVPNPTQPFDQSRSWWAKWASEYMAKQLFHLRQTPIRPELMQSETYKAMQDCSDRDLQDDGFYCKLVVETWDWIRAVNALVVDLTDVDRV